MGVGRWILVSYLASGCLAWESVLVLSVVCERIAFGSSPWVRLLCSRWRRPYRYFLLLAVYLCFGVVVVFCVVGVGLWVERTAVSFLCYLAGGRRVVWGLKSCRMCGLRWWTL